MRNTVTTGLNLLAGIALVYVLVQGIELRDQAWTVSRLLAVAVGWLVGRWIVARLPLDPAEQ